MKYPSLKNVTLILIAAALISGAFLLAEYKNKRIDNVVYEANLVSTSTPALSPDLQNMDSDNDGLKDWEEVLLGTNSHNPDTDRDGTSDGKETNLGRNPLVKGPNDKVSTTIASKTTKTEDLAPIDILSRNFFARYMELRQAGLSQDKYSQTELVQQVLKGGIVLPTAKIYKISDIKIANVDGKSAIEKYGNDVGTIFTIYNTSSKNEAMLAKEYFEKENPDILKKIDPIILSYKNILNALLKVEVPQSISSTHLTLVNAISGSLFTAEAFRKANIDGLSGIQGTAQYLTNFKNLFDSFTSIKNYISSLGIVYTKGQGGAFFIQIK